MSNNFVTLILKTSLSLTAQKKTVKLRAKLRATLWLNKKPNRNKTTATNSISNLPTILQARASRFLASSYLFPAYSAYGIGREQTFPLDHHNGDS